MNKDLYLKLGLYNDLITDGDNEEEVIEAIEDEFKKFNFNNDGIVFMTIHPLEIDYKEDNIYEILDFFIYFRHVDLKDVMYDIYNVYILKEKFLEEISKLGFVLNFLCEQFKKDINNNKISFDKAMHFGKYFECDILFINEKWTLNNKELTFNNKFNETVNIFDDIKHLKFGNRFDQKITIPDSVKHLEFGYDFNREIIIPNSVEHLVFGRDFNQEIIIPNSVKHLKFGWYFNQLITIPNSVEHLEFGGDFNQEIIIPNSVKHLKFGRYFNRPITIPYSVEHLQFGVIFNQPITIPNSVISLIYSREEIEIGSEHDLFTFEE